MKMKQIIVLSRTVFLLVITTWFFSSLISGSPGTVPASEGIKFVLSLPTPLFHFQSDLLGQARIAIGTKHKWNIVYYVISCQRLCWIAVNNDIIKSISRQLNYPAVNLEILRFKNPNVTSGLNLTVFIIEANFEVFVIMLKPMFDENFSIKMDASLLYPSSLVFDEFYVVTLGIFSYVIIVSHEYSCTSVEIKLASTIDDTIPVLECGDPRPTDDHNCGNIHGQSDVNSISKKCSSFFDLLSYQSLYIDSPEMSESHNLSFRDITGTYIKTNRPVTVFAGSKEVVQNSDMNFYTVPPVDAYGTYSIIPPNFILDQDQTVKMVTIDANNTIHIQMNTNLTSIMLENPSDWSEVTTFGTDCIAIRSEFTIIIFLIMFPIDMGSCMMSITPEHLWAQSYIWLDFSLINVKDHDLTHYVMIVARNEYTVDLKLDENTIPAEEWQSMKPTFSKNTYSFVARRFNSSNSQHEAYHPQPRVRFYLIIQSMAFRDSYCTSPARLFLGNNCTETPMVKGDFVDNDCDQRIDEEEEDGIDNDGDGLIDEDLSAPFKVDGSWGEWAEEVCVVECGSTSGWNQRKRQCTNPAPQGGGEMCKGPMVEFKDRCMSALVKCTQYCPRKTWGFNCSQACPHCYPDCDKQSGVCELCDTGMTGTYCNITCPTNCAVCQTNKKCTDCVFGFDLSSNCTIKCPNLTYGSMCLNCSTQCKGRKCNIRNGECKNCESAHNYGPFCELECSDNCSSKHCDRKTGDCGHCVDGLWHSKCNQTCINVCADGTCNRQSGMCVIGKPKKPFDLEKTLDRAIKVLIVIVSIMLIYRFIKRCCQLYRALKESECCKCSSKKKEEPAVEEEIKEAPGDKYATELLKRRNEVKMQLLKQQRMRKTHK